MRRKPPCPHLHLEISDRQPGELCCLAQRKLSAGKQSQRQFQFGVGSRQVSGLKQPCRQFQSAARSSYVRQVLQKGMEVLVEVGVLVG